MENVRRSFYENMYRSGRIPPKPSGILGKIFTKLRRHELHRRDAVFALTGQGKRFLDIGCGSGSLMALAKKGKFEEVYGIDIATNVIKGARTNLKKALPNLDGVFFQKADVDEKIPFPANYFDTITAVALLEHIFNPNFVIREIKRVLKPGGIFILEVPNIAWLPRRINLLLGQLPRTADEIGWDGGHLHYFTFKTLESLLKENGFTIVVKSTSGIFSSFRKLWPSILGGDIIIKAVNKK